MEKCVYSYCESAFRRNFGKITNIRLYTIKLEGFWPTEVYIFEIYSRRAFQCNVAWCAMLAIAKVTE